MAAASDFDLDVPASWMIGDTVLDVKAGIAAGCQTIWLTGQNQVTDEVVPTVYAPRLVEAAEFVLANSKVG